MSSGILTLFDQDFAPKESNEDALAAAKAKKTSRTGKGRDAKDDAVDYGLFDAIPDTAIPLVQVEVPTPDVELLAEPAMEAIISDVIPVAAVEIVDAVPVIEAVAPIVQEPVFVAVVVEPIDSMPTPVEMLVADVIEPVVLMQASAPTVIAAKEEIPATPKPKRTRKPAEQGIQPDLPTDWKAEKQYYTIGEVAALFQVNTSHIRFWTNEFSLKVRTTRKGDRLYTGPQRQELKAIHHLVKERGFKLSGAKAKMKEHKKKEVQSIGLKESLVLLRDRLVILRNQLN